MKKIVPNSAVLIPDTATHVFKGVVFDVYQWEQPLFDGSSATFEMLRRPDTSAVIGIVDNKIMVLDDEQPLKGTQATFAGGRVDDTDASTLAAAQRETLEETGYAFTNWRLVAVQQPVLKIEWFIHYYVAWDTKKVAAPNPGAGEKITVFLKELAEVKAMVGRGEGYLGQVKDLFSRVNSIEEVRALPEFKGQEIER